MHNKLINSVLIGQFHYNIHTHVCTHKFENTRIYQRYKHMNSLNVLNFYVPLFFLKNKI